MASRPLPPRPTEILTVVVVGEIWILDLGQNLLEVSIGCLRSWVRCLRLVS